MPIQVGIHLSNWGPFASPATIRQLAAAAEELGYDSVWVSDHVVIPDRFDSPYPFPGGVFKAESAESCFEPLITLAVVAGATKRVKVGTSVLITPQREPLLMAKQISTLDTLSGGRVEIGVAVGWLAEEFEALGVSHFADRGAVLDEHLKAFRMLWTEDRPRFDGQFCHFPTLRFLPKPGRPGGPPITVGGHGAVALRRAAERADGWHPFGFPPEQLVTPVADLRRMAAAAGRPEPQVVLRAFAQVTDESGLVPGRPLIGPLDAITACLRRYAEVGVTTIVLSPAPGRPMAESIDTMERIASVLPGVRG